MRSCVTQSMPKGQFSCDVGLLFFCTPFLGLWWLQLGWSLFDEQCVLLGGCGRLSLWFRRQRSQ